MRQLIAVVIVGSILVVLLAIFGSGEKREDDLARSITQWVEKSK